MAHITVNLMTMSAVSSKKKTTSSIGSMNVFDNILLMGEDSDEEEEEVSDDSDGEHVKKATSNEHKEYIEEIIKESKPLLLKRHSSELSLEQGLQKIKQSSKADMDRSRDRKEPISILGTKQVYDTLPILKNPKPKKAVRFNMGKNETCEIIQPELDDDDDDDTNRINNKKNMMRNVRFTDDLDTSDEDEEEGEKDDKEDEAHEKEKHNQTIQNGFHGDTKNQINDDIYELRKAREELLKETEELRSVHENEMKKLREEYQRRREDYYTELDEVRAEVDEKMMKDSSGLGSNSLDVNNNDNTEILSRKDRIEREMKNLQAQEEELEKKKAEISEQEQELKDYQRYLERRHKSLNEKEEDLCTLQDELEELEDVLKGKKEKLLDEKSTIEMISTTCSHDDTEIERTRLELIDSLKTEAELRERIRTKDNDAEKNLEKILQLEDENKKLQAKTRLLESQLTINLKSSAGGNKLAEKRISLRTMSTIPVDSKTGEYITPKSVTPRNSSKNSLSPNPFSPVSSTCSSPSHELNNTKSTDNSPLHQTKHNEEEHTKTRNNTRTQDSPTVSKTCSVM